MRTLSQLYLSSVLDEHHHIRVSQSYGRKSLTRSHLPMTLTQVLCSRGVCVLLVYIALLAAGVVNGCK